MMATSYWSSDDEFEVERIVDSRINSKTLKREFLIKWKGYTDFVNSWEPEAHLEGCKDLVDEFVRVLPSRSGRALKRKAALAISESESDDSPSDSPSDLSTISELSSAPSDLEVLSDSFDSDNLIIPRPSSALPSKQRSFLEGMNKFQAMLDAIPGAKLRIANSVNYDPPPEHFVYITRFIYGVGVPAPDPAFLTGCECTGGNCSSGACSCLTQTDSKQHTCHYTPDGRLIIVPGKQPFIYECNQSCACANQGNCLNRVIQNGRTVPLEIFQMGDARGWAVRSTSFIPAGTFIDLYHGEIITDQEADDRFKNVYKGDGRSLYLFDLDFSAEHGSKADYTIDAYTYGSVSRFFNHSCDPNLLVVPCFIDHLDQSLHFIAFFAARDIRPDQELCFDYTNERYKFSGNLNGKASNKVYSDGHVPCLCGAANCRKFVYPSFQ